MHPILAGDRLCSKWLLSPAQAAASGRPRLSRGGCQMPPAPPVPPPRAFSKATDGSETPHHLAGHREPAGHRAVFHPLHPGVFQRSASAHHPHRGPGVVLRDCRVRPAGPADSGVLQHLAAKLSGGRRHVAADQRHEHAQRAAGRGQAPHARVRRRRRKSRRRQQHCRGAPHHSPAHRACPHVHRGDLRRPCANLLAARGAGRRWSAASPAW